MAWRPLRGISLFAFILVTVFALAVFSFDPSASLGREGVVAETMDATSGGHVIRIDRTYSRPSYWTLLPFNPPFWPVVSLLIAILGMWATRNIVDKHRYWIRSILLGLILAPLPVPGGAHIPDSGVVPAAAFLIVGIGSLFVALFQPVALVMFVWSIPGITVTFLTIFLIKVALELFDDGNPLSNKTYLGMVAAGIFAIACVYYGFPRLYEISAPNSPPPPRVLPAETSSKKARGVVLPADSNARFQENNEPDGPGGN